MKRDMDLIRLLLLRQEGDEQAAKLIAENYDQQTLAFHGAMVIEAGFIQGAVSTDEHGLPRATRLLRLTWEGYEFLESIRNETTWNKAKAAVIKTGTGWTMPILKEVLKAVIMAHLPGGMIPHP